MLGPAGTEVRPWGSGPGVGRSPGLGQGWVRSGRVRLGSEALLMDTEAPTSRGRSRLAALLWALVLPAGMRGSWPVASRAPALAPDEAQAQAEEPVLPRCGAEPLAPGAGALG